MNAALELLQQQRQQLSLDQYGIPQALTSLVLTPRFQASSHVVYLVFGAGSPDPLLVVKMPRLAGESKSIAREARNLLQAQSSHPDGFDSIPRLVAHQTYQNREILVETALSGRAMDPDMVRQDAETCCDLTLRWLIGTAWASAQPALTEPGWFNRLVKGPLDRLAGLAPSAPDADLLAETWKRAAGLEGQDLPLVFEHGDLSHPNLLLLKQGGIGVVDWEQAEPQGLPLADLVFFLTYAAFARSKARTEKEYVQAFRSAFFGKEAWAVPYIRAYAVMLKLRTASLAPLLLLTFPRYLASLLDRLTPEHASNDLRGKQRDWLRANRYHALWAFAAEHYEELNW